MKYKLNNLKVIIVLLIFFIFILQKEILACTFPAFVITLSITQRILFNLVSFFSLSIFLTTVIIILLVIGLLKLTFL